MNLLSIYVVLATLLGISRANAAPKECTKKIVYLKQTHAIVTDTGIEVSPENLEEVAQSQFKIASYIEKHRDVPVFSEQAGQTFSIKAFSVNEVQQMTERFRQTFPEGLSETFSDLNREQKLLLAQSGGEAVELMIGRIDTVFGTTESNEVQDQVIAEARKAMQESGEEYLQEGSSGFKKVFDVRERLALTEINKYFSKNPAAAEVILVYGSLHDFSRHSDLFPSQCVIVVQP